MGNGELAQQLRVNTTKLAEDSSSIISTHIRQLTTACNSSSRGSDISGLLRDLHFLLPHLGGVGKQRCLGCPGILAEV